MTRSKAYIDKTRGKGNTGHLIHSHYSSWIKARRKEPQPPF